MTTCKLFPGFLDRISVRRWVAKVYSGKWFKRVFVLYSISPLKKATCSIFTLRTSIKQTAVVDAFFFNFTPSFLNFTRRTLYTMVALRSDHVTHCQNEQGFSFSEQTKNGLSKLGLKMPFTTRI